VEPYDSLRSYLEQVARSYLGLGPTDDLHVDADGDIPIRQGSALYHVSLLEHSPPLVRVWSIVLDGVEATPELLEELNDVNATIVAVRLYALAGRVVAATEIRADTLDAAELEFACNSIGHLADWIDTTLAVRFGGRKRFDDGPGEPT
jgi:hypothetical protein